jgi:hypothetical protein
MKIKVLLLFIVITNIAFGQIQHKPIPGTKYSIVPPEGFVTATNFSGFQNTSIGASIMVTEMPASVQAINEGFTVSNLKSKGMILLNKETIFFNNAKATYIKLSQQANGTTYLKQILVFGDSKKTVLVNGIYPEASKAIEADIKKSLLSTSFNKDQGDDPLDAVKFKIDVSNTDLKLAKYMAGSLIYTVDGKIPTEKPSLIVGNSIAKVSPEDQKQYSIERLKQLPRGNLSEIKEIDPIQIDNLNGYEIIAKGKTKDAKEELIYSIMLFDNNGDYFIIVGMAAEDFENNLKKFKSIARTFQRK